MLQKKLIVVMLWINDVKLLNLNFRYKTYFFYSTGNDLARVLRWGPGYTGGEDPLNLLRDVIDAEEIKLDRWTVVFHPEDKSDEAGIKQVNSTGKKRQKLSKMKVTNEQIRKAGQSYNIIQWCFAVREFYWVVEMIWYAVCAILLNVQFLIGMSYWKNGIINQFGALNNTHN